MTDAGRRVASPPGPEEAQRLMADEHGLDQDRLVWMFTQMLRIREFEERVKRSFTELPGGKIVEAARQVLSTTLVV